MIYLLLILSILIWPFGQLLNINLPGVVQTIYPLDLVCGLLAVSLVCSPKGRQTILRDPLSKPLAIFLTGALLSLVFNLGSLVSGGLMFPLLYLARLAIYSSVYFASKIAGPKPISRYVLISLITFCILGLLQYLLFPDMRYLKWLGFDDHYYRLIGSFYDPNFTGAILAGATLFFVSLGQWLISVPLLILLALTFSRASYLVFFLGLIYLGLAQKKWGLLAFTILLAIIVFLIPKPFGEGVNLFRTFSIFSRLYSWQAGLDLFWQRPFLGWGYNTLRSLTGERFQIDNSFLYIAGTTGLVGLLAFLNLLKNSLIQIKHIAPKVFILALLAHSLFNNSLFYIWIYFAFWLVLGLPSKEYKES